MTVDKLTVDKYGAVSGQLPPLSSTEVITVVGGLGEPPKRLGSSDCRWSALLRETSHPRIDGSWLW